MSYEAIYNGARDALRCNAGDRIESAARECFDISRIQSIAQEAIVSIEHQMTMPHVLMRPRVFMDGNKWCAMYGSNLMEGVAGFGNSPQEACDAFDAAWFKKGGAS